MSSSAISSSSPFAIASFVPHRALQQIGKNAPFFIVQVSQNA